MDSDVALICRFPASSSGQGRRGGFTAAEGIDAGWRRRLQLAAVVDPLHGILDPGVIRPLVVVVVVVCV